MLPCGWLLLLPLFYYLWWSDPEHFTYVTALWQLSDHLRLFHLLGPHRTVYFVFQLLGQTLLFATLWTIACQAPLSSTDSWNLLKLCPLNWRCYLTISSSAAPFSFCLQSFPAQGLFQWVGSSLQVANVLELQLQHQSFQWTFRVDVL